MDAIIHKTIEGLIAFACLAPFAITIYVAIIAVVTGIFAPSSQEK
jgi:hypothetical protein